MGRENGFSYQILVLVIIIVIAIAGVIINQLVGRNGVINKVAQVEDNYSKEDVLEKLNYKITQKFIEINNEAKANNKSVSELYNSDVVIEFLKQNLIIEETYNENGNLQDGVYNINVEKLKEEDEIIHYNGTYKLEKIDEKYIVLYYDNENNAKEVGELQIQQTM